MNPAARAEPEPRFTTIADGVIAQVIEPVKRLPPRLETLLSTMLVYRRLPLRPRGTRQACTDGEHALAEWIRGLYRGLELRLSLCAFCGVVEVRDVSLDILDRQIVGRSGPRRRSAVLGWYSGSRPRGREYR